MPRRSHQPPASGSFEALVAQLRADDYRERREAAAALGRLNDARAVEPLGRALADTSVQVQLAAVAALDLLGDARAVEWLFGATVDRDERVAGAAMQALRARWDGRETGPLLRGLRWWPRRVRRILVALAQAEIAEPVIALLAAADARLRAKTVAALAEADHRGGTGLLARGLAEQRPGRRAEAARALGASRRPYAVGPLRDLLRDEHHQVRLAASEGLAALGAPAGAALADLRARGREDPSFWVRWACRRAARAIETALRAAPPELEAADAPLGTGSELEAAGPVEDDDEPEERRPPWWMFWRYWR